MGERESNESFPWLLNCDCWQLWMQCFNDWKGIGVSLLWSNFWVDFAKHKVWFTQVLNRTLCKIIQIFYNIEKKYSINSILFITTLKSMSLTIIRKWWKKISWAFKDKNYSTKKLHCIKNDSGKILSNVFCFLPQKFKALRLRIFALTFLLTYF